MKCTDNNSETNKKLIGQVATIVLSVIVISAVIILAYLKYTDTKRYDYSVSNYEKEFYASALEDKELFASNLCTTPSDVTLDGFNLREDIHGAAIFDITDNKVLYGEELFTKIYPASTTKLLTAYIAFKYGNMDDIVTVSNNAVNIPGDAQKCGIKPGDKISMYDLVAGLLLYSGNDAAIAIAEHISGNTEEFVDLMNSEAGKLGAVHTHFVNPHGLHNDDHYTTIYDLYLMFNACMEYEEFNNIYSQSHYVASVNSAKGEEKVIGWTASNFFSSGDFTIADGFTSNGGKTGTTDKAGSCLIFKTTYENGKECIAVLMGAKDKKDLYSEINIMLNAGKSVLND